ncbi:MAG: hypothetical protein OXT74_14450 [Candidatus Poribacteria bacterium]|nr:hypothetical protein [Candidatus Poribacteria bacterium]
MPDDGRDGDEVYYNDKPYHYYNGMWQMNGDGDRLSQEHAGR